MTRRIVPVLLLLCFTASSAEAVVGLVRTGQIHSQIAATQGQPTAPDSPLHQHRDDHQHPNSGDHCAHIHPPALPAGEAAVTLFGPAMQCLASPSPDPREGPVLPTLPHPPKV